MSRVTVPDAVSGYIDAGVVSVSDIEGARVLLSLAARTHDVPVDPLTWVMIGLVLGTVRGGHSCIDLDDVGRWAPDAPDLEWPTDPQRWLEILERHRDLVGEPSAPGIRPRPPLVRDGHRLYMARVHHEETVVARRLTAADGEGVRIILGGPGTGKTTRVARALAEWSDGVLPSLALCAPTGKASRRLKEVLETVLRKENAPPSVLDALKDAPSMTVHKLLGYSPGRSPRYRHHAGEPLPYELVIVDEASMMSLDTMARLLDALDPAARIWLVGDPDQLASVGAGTVLADIDAGSVDSGAVLHRRTVRLDEQHRFPADSPIARLAAAVRNGDCTAVTDVLSARAEDCRWIDPMADPRGIEEVLAGVVDHAAAMATAARAGDAEAVLGLKAGLQVLSATHGGALGVNDWNRLVEQGLGVGAARLMYPGKPLMVTRNDSATGLSNGDVGVVIAVEDGSSHLTAVFGNPEAPVEVPLVRLPRVETVHALTIHKSQGSEYDHVVVVLPQVASRIVTRELLYTGISRPRTKLTIIATAEAIDRAVHTRVQRATGLADRL